MSTDETYLESFIESITTLPHEMKRNLAHMKTLDVHCSSLVQELRELEEEYLDRAHSMIHKFPVQSKAQHQQQQQQQKQKEIILIAQKKRKLEESKGDLLDGDGDGDGDSGEGEDKDSKDNSTNNDNDDINSSDNMKEEGNSSNVSGNGNNGNGNSGNGNSENKEQYLYIPKHGIPVKTKKAKKSSSTTANTTSESIEKKETILVIPTTEELNYHIQNPKQLLKIAKLRKETRQITEEKVAVVNQVCSLLDSHLQRIDTDLEKFESLLKTTGQYQETIAAQNGGIAKPDDLAAIQELPNSPDWILAKVITHDANTQMYKLADEDIESNKTFTLPESQVVILGIGGLESIRKGDVIYAVYPDTTSFYQATVAQAPKKVAGGNSFVLVNFKDDGDENGITHDKAVLMKHIMRVPYGAMQ